MKKKVLILILLSILLILRAQDNIKIISIANDGFLLTTDTCKVIIDGIFTKGNTNFFYPSDQILTKERNADAPFDSIDFILNSHYHADHINAGYIVEHMINDTLPVFIGTQQSFGLMAAVSNFNEVLNRVLAITPSAGVIVDTTIKGLDFKISKFIHHNDNSNQHQVNAYVFSMNNIRIFHPGDGQLNNMAELEALNLDDDSIDIAFIPFWIVGDELESIGRQVISYLNPKIIIIMHVWVSEKEYFQNRIKEIDNFPPVYYLDESLDSLNIVKSGNSLIVEEGLVALSEIKNPAPTIFFPNPTDGIIHFDPILNSAKRCVVELYSLHGQLLSQSSNDNNDLTTIDFSEILQGMYLLQITTPHQLIVKKLIKE